MNLSDETLNLSDEAFKLTFLSRLLVPQMSVYRYQEAGPNHILPCYQYLLMVKFGYNMIYMFIFYSFISKL